MFEFKRLVEANMQQLAELLSSEHGKVVARASRDRPGKGHHPEHGQPSPPDGRGAGLGTAVDDEDDAPRVGRYLAAQLRPVAALG